PLLKESDEEGAEKIPDSKGKMNSDAEEKASDKTKPAVVIDLEEIAGRIVALPIEAGTIQDLAPGTDGQIYFIRRAGVPRNGGRPGGGKPSLRRFDRKPREEETLAEGIDEFQLSADRKKILYRAGELAGPPLPGVPPAGAIILGIVDAGKYTKGDGALKL